MKQEVFKIGDMPALLIGERQDKVYLFVHGKDGNKEEALLFAKVACEAGYQVLSVDLPKHGERKKEEKEFTPWVAVPELKKVCTYMKENWRKMSLRANSIGAWFSMLAFAEESVNRALFVSPMVDMEQLIKNMMMWANVNEEELKEKGIIETSFGETLSWEYLTYVRKNPIHWKADTRVLYAGQDNLVTRDVMDQFIENTSATLTVMEDGEHWFYTPKQLEVLEKWEKENM